MPHEPSHLQLAIYEHQDKYPKKPLVVMARAGTGKSSTIEALTRRVPQGKVALVCAFNTKICEEMRPRIEAPHVVKTLHAVGLSAVTRMWGRVQINGNRTTEVIESVLPAAEHRTKTFGHIRKIVSMAMAKLVEKEEDIAGLIDEYDCYPDASDDEEFEKQMRQYVAWTQAVLRKSREKSPTISFDDMVYLAAYFNLRGTQYDYVYVDEAQDLTPAQLVVAKNACRRGGKLIAVGDDLQAIYGFRGAGRDSIGDIIRDLGAEVLPLSISYRCPKAVVRLVNNLVEDFSAPEWAKEGVVEVVAMSTCIREAAPGDLIVSRVNSTLSVFAMQLLLKGVRCKILGKDLSKGLISLVDKQRRTNVKDMLASLAEYTRQEVERLEAAKKEDRIEELLDQVEAIRALSEGMTTTYELRARLSSLFTDDEEDTSVVVLSSTHRSKGLEFDRVWMLESTYRIESQEGKNLYYVAATRAKAELYLVQVPKKDGKVPPSIAERWARRDPEDERE